MIPEKYLPRKGFDAFFIPLVILLVAVASFGLGRLSRIEEGKGSLTIYQHGVPAEPVAVGADMPAAAASASGNFLASKSGTRYYLPSCSGAKNIKPENIIWFETAAQAQAAGYTPAANCPGL